MDARTYTNTQQFEWINDKIEHFTIISNKYKSNCKHDSDEN